MDFHAAEPPEKALTRVAVQACELVGFEFRREHITHYENLANLDQVVNTGFTFAGFPSSS